MKKGIKQITEGEIYEIRILLKEGNSIPETALKVGRHKSTIYRLLSNNGVKYNEIKYRYTGGKGGIKSTKGEYLRIEVKRKIQFSARTVFLKRRLRRSKASVRYCNIIFLQFTKNRYNNIENLFFNFLHYVDKKLSKILYIRRSYKNFG